MSTARHRLQREREASLNPLLVADDVRVVLRQKGFIRQADGSYSKVAPVAKSSEPLPVAPAPKAAQETL